MTVSTTTNKITYIGNGMTTEFAVPFPFLEEGHLKVYQLADGIQTERTDWTTESGDLTFETAPESGAEILILREVPLTQETDYRENAILPAETLERCFDKLTMQVQQLKEKTDRAVTVDVFDDTNASELLPGIHKAVSDAAGYADTAAGKVAEATAQAQNAANSAITATGQAVLAQSAADSAATSETNTAAMLGIKADVDLGNLTEKGKEKIAYLSIPDYSTGVDFSNGVQITPAYNCAVFCVVKNSTFNAAGSIKVEIGNETFNIDGTSAGHICLPLFFMVSKGITFSVTTLNSENVKLRYYKLIGG